MNDIREFMDYIDGLGSDDEQQVEVEVCEEAHVEPSEPAEEIGGEKISDVVASILADSDGQKAEKLKALVGAFFEDIKAIQNEDHSEVDDDFGADFDAPKDF